AAADSHGRVHPLGISVAAGSYYPYLVSLSVFLSVFALPVIGAIADRSAHRKRLLALAAYTGAAITCGFAAIPAKGYLLGGALFVLANIALSAASVVYNSFLSQLVDADRRDATSSLGWAIGYIGGGLNLLLALAAVTFIGEKASVVRGVMVFCGLWWAAFAVLPQQILAGTILVVQFVAFGGALLLGLIASRVGAWKTILGSLVAWIGVILVTFWLPARSPGLFLLVGAAIGIVLGGSQALSRSL